MDDLLVILRAGAREEVEGDAELLPVAQELRVKLIDHLLRRAAFLIGAHCDGRAVLIAAGNHQHAVTCHPLITSEDIRGQIGSGDMSEMQRAVRVGPRDGDEDRPQ